jgi:hypothetical protein
VTQLGPPWPVIMVHSVSAGPECRGPRSSRDYRGASVRSEVVVSGKLLGASLVGAKRVVARCDFSLTDTLDSSQVCQRMSVGHPAARTMSVRRQRVTSCFLSPVSNRCSPWGQTCHIGPAISRRFHPSPCHFCTRRSAFGLSLSVHGSTQVYTR